MDNRIYCALPWYTMQLHLDGQFGPCCHVKIPNDVVPDSLEQVMELFNGRQMQHLRKALVTGNTFGIPCDRCYDRYFDTDHDIFGMGADLPRYSLHAEKFDTRYGQANAHYRRGDLVVSEPPLELYAYTSEACNLKCRVCVQNRNRKLFPIQNMIHIIHELGWDNIDRFGFVGGEPLLTEDGVKLLSFLSQEQPVGTCIYITTNGTLMHKHMNLLDRIDNLFLSVSIEGFGRAYEKVRVNAHWDTLIRNLMLLKERRQHHPNWRLNIYSIVMDSTLPYLLDVLKLSQLMDATLFYNREVTGHKDENFYVNPEVRPLGEIERRLDETIDYAVRVNAVKAVDSLRKLRTHLYRCRLDKKFVQKLIAMRLDQLIDKPFIVYGTGGHTEMLIEKHNLLDREPRAFADSDERKWGQDFRGYKIISPRMIPEQGKTVVISSKEYEAEIYRFLKDMFREDIEIVRLYA